MLIGFVVGPFAQLRDANNANGEWARNFLLFEPMFSCATRAVFSFGFNDTKYS